MVCHDTYTSARGYVEFITRKTRMVTIATCTLYCPPKESRSNLFPTCVECKNCYYVDYGVI